jgi:hypothetical protein
VVFTAGIVLDHGKISSLSKELLEELDNVNFKRNADHFATTPFLKQFKNYDNFLKVLKVLAYLTCEKACRGGGGPPILRNQEML